MLLTMLAGLSTGMLHTVSGPDHLAAVMPLAATDGRRGWFAGWMWGIGHTTGVVGIAIAVVLLRDQLPPIELLSQWSERLVGAALIGLGLWALRRALLLEVADHRHGVAGHGHLHVRRGPRWLVQRSHAHTSFYLGVLHGVAGSSHFLGVLPALALPSTMSSVAYIGGFGAGTVAAMTLFSAAIGQWSGCFGSHTAPRRAFMMVSAVSAVGVGGFWLIT
jgi:hypothetical protein